MYDEQDNNKPKSLGTEENKNMKTIEELRADQELLITAVNILDKITMEENDISREDADFTAYESWAVTDVKNELQAKIGELQVLINTKTATMTPMKMIIVNK